MPKPIILATWSFGKTATDAGWPVLIDPARSALDAVEVGATAVEDDPACMTVGAGSYPDRSGQVTLDALVMMSPAACGAVGCLRRHGQVTAIARRVMERTPHKLLVGQGADAFADEQGFAEMELTTAASRAAYRNWQAEHHAEDAALHRYRPGANIEEQDAIAADDEDRPHNRHHDTVGVLALDERGTLAGACSTSGYAFKAPGRVGDSPLIGQGLYVEPGVGAAVATGMGERIMGVCATFLAVELLRRGAPPLEAACDVLQRIMASYELTKDDQVAMIVLRPDGEWSCAALREGFSAAVRTRSRNELVPAVEVLMGR